MKLVRKNFLRWTNSRTTRTKDSIASFSQNDIGDPSPTPFVQ